MTHEFCFSLSGYELYDRDSPSFFHKSVEETLYSDNLRDIFIHRSTFPDLAFLRRSEAADSIGSRKAADRFLLYRDRAESILNFLPPFAALA